MVNFYYMSSIPVVQDNINDVVFPLNPDFEQYYDCEIKEIIVSKNEQTTVVINFTSTRNEKPIFEGDVYINLLTHEIVGMKGEVNHGMGLKIDDPDYKISNEHYMFDLSFHRTNKGGFNLNSVKNILTFNFSRNGITEQVIVTSELVAYNYGKEFKKKRNKKLSNKTNLVADIKETSYDAEYWRSNPIIKRTMYEKDIISSFMKSGLFQLKFQTK